MNHAPSHDSENIEKTSKKTKVTLKWITIYFLKKESQPLYEIYNKFQPSPHRNRDMCLHSINSQIFLIVTEKKTIFNISKK